MLKSLVLLSILVPSFVFAEYRAYQYIVKSKDPYARALNAEAQYITSTLNPQMYKSYHGGSLVSIDLLRTWICPGYTGKGMTVCPHPYDKAVKQ